MIKDGDIEVIWLPDEDVAKIRKLAVDFWMNDMGAVSPFTKKAMEIYKQIARTADWSSKRSQSGCFR